MASAADDLESVLNDEIVAREKVEEELNKTYQAKSGLLLAFTGFFSALMGGILRELFHPWCGSALEWAALSTLGFSMSLLFIAVFVLLRSSISERYEVPAPPDEWHTYKEKIEKLVEETRTDEAEALREFKRQLYKGKMESVKKAFWVNREKAARLGRAAKILQVVTLVGALGVGLFVWRALEPPGCAETQKQ
jgi:hypothetical protein